MSMLKLDNIDAHYGKLHILRQIDLEVKEGEVVSIIGSNGAGKSTIINTISCFIKPSAGSIEFCGKQIKGLFPHQVAKLGIIQVPERRHVFPQMTVLENLEMGAYLKHARADRKKSMETVFELFSELKKMKSRLAESLSGGEQQMLATARGLMSLPRLILLDEPSLGLAPLMVQGLFNKITAINESGTTVLLVEQNVLVSIRICDRAYVMESGRIVLSGNSDEILENAYVKKAYIGI